MMHSVQQHKSDKLVMIGMIWINDQTADNCSIVVADKQISEQDEADC
jgi:hypothetical protein